MSWRVPNLKACMEIMQNEDKELALKMKDHKKNQQTQKIKAQLRLETKVIETKIEDIAAAIKSHKENHKEIDLDPQNI